MLHFDEIRGLELLPFGLQLNIPRLQEFVTHIYIYIRIFINDILFKPIYTQIERCLLHHILRNVLERWTQVLPVQSILRATK